MFDLRAHIEGVLKGLKPDIGELVLKIETDAIMEGVSTWADQYATQLLRPDRTDF